MQDLLQWISAATALVSAILVWGFASGRWAQKRESDHQTLAEQVAAYVREEDSARRALVDRVTTDLGRLELMIKFNDEKQQLRFARVDELMAALEHRFDRLNIRANELQRQVSELQRQLDQQHGRGH